MSQAPITQNDSATTNQNTTTTLTILENDTDPDGTLNPSTLLIAQAPQHGQLSINANGTVTYQPTHNYIGSDQFTYLIQDNSGVYSNPATVNLSILNPIPTIETVTLDSTLTEGTPANFSAAATIAGNQPLTYTWELGDGTTTTEQTIQHTYLAVNSNNGPTATTQRTIAINNIAPNVNAGLSTEQVFVINVTDVNEAPIDLVLSQMSILENNALNTLIGIFSTLDQGHSQS